jgi:UDPglucose 6-dehydrogenase
LTPGATIVIKSTVPIGSCESFVEDLGKFGINLVSNPEFLAEGTALRDFLQPSRIVIGSNSESTAEKLDVLFEVIKSPRVFCSLTSAETIKHASNSLLAVKLSFVNELAQLCERTGANISEVTRGMSLDPRIGTGFLSPGPGWGGSCFPKDTLELNLTANKYGVQMHTVASAILSNQFATQRVIDRVLSMFGGSVKGRRIAVWGLTFKANTDDTRESPALKIVVDLAKHGAKIFAYDPQARADLPVNAVRAPSPLDACLEAEALLVLTEWGEFKTINAAEVKESMAGDPWILDLRRLLPATSWRSHFNNFELIGE